MFDTWAEPVTSKPWGILCVITDRFRQRSMPVERMTRRAKAANAVCHFAWERSHGNHSRRHPWQSVA
jgi:hypothetical protein